MRKLICILVVVLLLSGTSYALRISKPPRFTKLDDPVQITQLNNTLEDLWNLTNGRFTINIVTTNPDGSLKGDVGDMVLFNNSGSFFLAINTTGAKIWRSVALSDTP